MKKIWPYIVLLLILTAIPPEGGVAQPRLRQTDTLSLGGGDFYEVPFEILTDRAGTLTFSDVKDSPQFKKTGKNAFGFTNDVIWARFSVTIPEGSETEWFLEIGYPLLNHIDIYFPDGNGDYTVKQFGAKLPFNKRDIDYHNFLIRLIGEPGTYSYYIRFRTESAMNIPMAIHSLRNVISEINIQKTVFGLFYGALLIILIYNLLLAVSMKDLTYLSYTAFIVTLILVSLSLNGYGFQYIWSNTVWMNDLVPFFLFLTNFSLTAFSMMYADYKNLSKPLQYILFIYLGTISLFALASLILPYHLTIMVGAGSYIPGIIMVTFVIVDLIRKKSRDMYFYTLAFSFLFAGVIVTVNNRFGLLPNNIFTLWGFQIGTVFSIALFSLGLADRVNMLTNNLTEINLHLEQKVDERTKELSDAKDEIEAAMDELEATMEELEATNERLTASNQELEEAQVIHKKDMSMAANLQLSLLPNRSPQSPIYDIALAFRPKSGVSGDFYDFYVDNDLLIGAGLFDVSGHGIAPGLLTLLAKSIISATFVGLKDQKLGTVMDTINKKLLTEIRDIDYYLTGVLLRFKDDWIEYINCAHPDIICKKIDIGRSGKVLHKSGKRISGPFLGIEPQAGNECHQFQEIVFKLKQEDSLLLFTDSLAESQGAGGEEYGEARIVKSLHNAKGGTARELLDIVSSDFFNFLGERQPHDDTTLILIRRK
ncbi:MAG: hypothetical protein A2W19_11270 [Spirochaetes bacterium RBG_16_49_21]|nr:MAG: hypothetical protein A2W19_11270 [Spirochaetes bacterium RBG_16_49_21]